MKLLICHPKELEELDELVALVKLHSPDAEITTARESFLEFEKKFGKPVNWKRWFDYITGMLPGFSAQPRFDAFVVGPSSMMGKATQEIAREALRKGRKLFRVTPENEIVPATKVTVLDPENYKHGWVIS